MKIAVLSRKKSLYSTKRLVEACHQRGHEVCVLDYMHCYLNVTSKKRSSIYYNDKPINVDAIIPRISTEYTFYGTAVVRQFETTGCYTINPSLSITRSKDKLRAQQLLAMHHIDMPTTGIVHEASDIDRLMKIMGEPPLVIKLIEGTQGVGVVLAETKKAAESVIQTLTGLNANIIVQEYIKESSGTDIRCFVVGSKVVAAMERKGPPGEFRANIHRGGTAKAIRISKEEREIAVQAARIMGLRMAGVDIIRSKRGPLVLEINSSPGLEGIETATGKDIASLIVQHIEKHAKLKRSHYEG